MPLWHAESDIPNCRDMIKEYFKSLNETKLAGKQRSISKRQLKDKPPAKGADVYIPSRRSARLNKAIQNGSIILH